MRISVVMTTYNGEKYLRQQLDSLRTQTRKPDEVIICDDGSTDSTNRYVDKFIDDYDLKHWIHIKNQKNKGWKKNFIDAIEIATGDLIFTCDQDDIWYNYKLELMEEIMKKKKNIDLLCSTYDLEYDPREHKPEKVTVKRYKFRKDFMFVRSPGCVFCFRKSHFDDIKDMWYKDYPHDALLWRYALLKDSLYMLYEPLIYYRRHDATATGREKRSAQTKIEGMTYYLEAIKRLKRYIKNHPEHVSGDKAFKLDLIKKSREWASIRRLYLKTAKTGLWVKLLKYKDQYFNIKSYLADFYMANKKSK